MNLVDEYLHAVSILLPKLQRDDIIAELRDTILSRVEEREAELDRALTDDETEAVLREVGHPVVVAARYREGPQHVVGPALYPYWMFALKVGLAIEVAAALIVLVVQVVAFGEVGFALSRAINSVISGAIALVGVATIAAWIIERQGFRIGYLDNWHVRDLRFLEFVAWDWDTVREWLAGRGGPRPPYGRPPYGGAPPPPSARAAERKPEPRPQPERSPPQPPRDASEFAPLPPHWSPAGHGLMLIAAGAVLTIWWAGLARFDIGVWPNLLQMPGFDPGKLAAVDWEALRGVLFWPVLALGVWTILRGVVQFAHPWAVRLQGLMEALSGAAVAAFGGWLWTASPLSAAVRVDSFADFVSRWTPTNGDAIPLAAVATVVVATIVIAGLCGMMRGLWDMLAGPPPMGPWPAGI
jgi:hypothetical protein